MTGPRDSIDQPALRAIFSAPARLQRYLDVEAALALAQAELGVIPSQAAEQIAAAARLGQLDVDRIAAGQAETGHLMVPLDGRPHALAAGGVDHLRLLSP